ncbi:hypothetical protein [Alteribacter keqinensis]|uniref:Uncharacterized protein n=1 Tax=Alteribacter keqinensis TaxID=2483800 RepID=A0A3M7TSG0_9BACI|nr:hypothetical protein [Alteribacter keqinensis]RNA68550.1 hypothetical protein EBO34_00835 [Alteribacter keqinensis]
MEEYELFISLLEPKDMKEICVRFNIQVEGFSRLRITPPREKMVDAIRIYLINGLMKKKKRAINFATLLNSISNSMIERDPTLRELTLEEFIIRVKIDRNIKLYQGFAMLYSIHNNIFYEFRELLFQNRKEGKWLFSNLTNADNLPSLDLIKSLIHQQSSSEFATIHKKLKSYEKLEKNRIGEELYEKLKLEISGSEEKLLQELVRTPKAEHTCLYLVFLLESDNYKYSNYSFIVKEIDSAYKSQVIIQRVKEYKEMTNLQLKYREEVNFLSEKNEMLEAKNEELLLSIKEKNTLISETEILRKKLMEEKTYIQKNEPFRLFFYKLLIDKDFLIITMEKDSFEETPFEEIVINKKEFSTISKRDFKKIKGKYLFFIRNSFTKREWEEIKKFLDTKNLLYFEVGRYTITDYIEEIILHLYREEKNYEFYNYT